MPALAILKKVFIFSILFSFCSLESLAYIKLKSSDLNAYRRLSSAQVSNINEKQVHASIVRSIRWLSAVEKRYKRSLRFRKKSR